MKQLKETVAKRGKQAQTLRHLLSPALEKYLLVGIDLDKGFHSAYAAPAFGP